MVSIGICLNLDDLQITGIRFQFFIDIFETFDLLEEDAEFPEIDKSALGFPIGWANEPLWA